MSAEERILEAVLVYLGRRLGPGAVLRAVRLDVTGSDGIRQEIRLKTGSLGVSSDDEGEPAATSIRSAILEVLGEAGVPLKGQAIARRAGRSYSGTFRATLAAMVRDGELLLGVEGYTLGEDGQD